MNNKGVTLVELMVSLVLITIVMIFIFNLLFEMKNEDYLSSSKSDDAMKRSEIIHLIQNDFINYKLKKVTQISCTNGATFCINFSFHETSDKKLFFFKDHLVYNDEVFYISVGSFETDKTTYCRYSVNKETKLEGTNNQIIESYYNYFKLTIPITHDATVKRKTTIDLSYLSTKKAKRLESVPASFNINGKNIHNIC